MDNTTAPTLESTYNPTTYITSFAPTYEPTYDPFNYPTASPHFVIVTQNYKQSAEDDSHGAPDGGYKYNLFMGLIIIAILCCVCMMISFWKNNKRHKGKSKPSYETQAGKSPANQAQKNANAQNLIMINLKGTKQRNTSMQSPTISRLSPINTHTSADSHNEPTNSAKEGLVKNQKEKTEEKTDEKLTIEDSESEILRKSNQINNNWSSDSQSEKNINETKMDMYTKLDADINGSDSVAHSIAEKSHNSNGIDVVKQWLGEIHSSEYYNAFIEHGFTSKKISMIYHLDNSDLKEMGVNKIADRKMILKHIYVLKNIVNGEENSYDVTAEEEESDGYWETTEFKHVGASSVNNIIGHHKNSITT